LIKYGRYERKKIMNNKKIQIILYSSVGIICGSLAGLIPLYRLIILAIGIGLLVGIVNSIILKLDKDK
jgi:hypothetical protein